MHLGELLLARTDDVVDRIVAASAASGVNLDDTVEKRFRRTGTLSTVAVAGWMAGETLESAREVGHEVWQIFGQLAAQRAASLTEVTKRCLRWRTAAGEVAAEIAAELDLSPQVLAQALLILQTTLDVTLVHVCEAFEAERQHADEELAFLATHDPLTGLPNRTLILDRIEQMIARSRRLKTPIAAVFIDLDNFKLVNDTLGHGAGDELLEAVTARLQTVLRETDALGRIGGDEFVVIAEGVSLDAGPELIAERLSEALVEPFMLLGGKSRVEVRASFGVASGLGISPDELLSNADIAMYRAKWDGKNRCVVFESEMQGAVQSRMELEMDLREALANEQFNLVYQPIVALSDMRPTGVEALIRWQHPTRGEVQPEDFIPLLEETGLIMQIGRWVLNEACAQSALWRDAGHDAGIAVNVSGRQLDSDEIVADVEGALAQSGLDPHALTIEITETTLMRNAEETARRLSAIKGLGVRIAIDDFGTGYSSLSHVQKFPVDALKIDRSFITGLLHNQEGEAIIHTLVQLGKALSIETVAEGIEQQLELSQLQSELCDSGQGFLFARPLDAAATEGFLESWAASRVAAA
ncbi:MAG TPA: EAL domain-containing protein [Solirubrobacteraceae bacterium]|jgi:diguanylate cyclase (GGDEF)-like protein|nr:EAL domain-containing protein [Solirubrobacteraceae bacterium]